MKIIALQAENIKKLVAVTIRPDGNLVQITGKNGQGKTSVLDSIWWALAGASHIQMAPIRKGETKARIRLDLGEIVVTRHFKTGVDGEMSSSLTVENAEGATFKGPQAMLDGLLGELTFDPLAFARATTKEQFDIAKKFAPAIDFDGIDLANKADYDARTEINRKLRESQGAAAKITVLPDAPNEAIDEIALIEELEEAGKHNTEIQKRQAAREKAAEDVLSLRQNAERLRESAIENEKKAEALQGKLDAAEALPEPKDTVSIKARIGTARVANEARMSKLAHRKHMDSVHLYEAQSKKLTEAIDARVNEREKKIAETKLPVPGLGFGRDSLLLNGVPLDQASDAEQLRTSIAIAMALNPKLRVIRVRDGSLLDEESMALLSSMADDKDYQVWVERVDSSGKVGFVLSDGHVCHVSEEAISGGDKREAIPEQA